jgi:hypothetical protein
MAEQIATVYIPSLMIIRPPRPNSFVTAAYIIATLLQVVNKENALFIDLESGYAVEFEHRPGRRTTVVHGLVFCTYSGRRYSDSVLVAKPILIGVWGQNIDSLSRDLSRKLASTSAKATRTPASIPVIRGFFFQEELFEARPVPRAFLLR